MTIIGAVIGSTMTPASQRAVAERGLQVLGLQEHHRPVAADEAEAGGAGPEVRAVAEQVELDDRVLDPVLDEPEGHEQGDAEAERAQRPRRAPAPGLALDQREYDERQPEPDREQAGHVDASAGAGSRCSLVETTTSTTPSRQKGRLIQKIQRQLTDLEQRAAQQRPDAQGQGRDAGPDAERPRPLRRGEDRGDDGQRQPEQRRGAQALDQAADDQHLLLARGRADRRAQREQAHADQEDPPPPEHVAEPAGGDHGGGEHEEVAVDHPLQPGRGGADVVGDRRQGDVDDGRVEHEHEQAHAGADERPPAAVGLGQPGNGGEAGGGGGHGDILAPRLLARRRGQRMTPSPLHAAPARAAPRCARS